MSPDEERRLVAALDDLTTATERIARCTRDMLELVRAGVLGVDPEVSSDETLEARADWQAFLTEHPELTPANPVDLTEADVLKVLKQALQDRNARGAVFACEVAGVLFGPLGRPDDPLRKSRVSQVANRLGNLAHAGLVVRLRPRSGAHTSNLWTLPGREVAEYVRRGWEGGDRG